jgi:dolichyl-phosphate-mannose-protein mannosyltransferase
MSFSQNRFPLLRDMLYLVMIGPQRAMIHKGEREISANAVSTGRIPLPLTIAVFALAFLLPALPWLSGAVTIPWDAKSQFFPPVQFLATSIARGEWPWWTPNVFAGWPQISDPQSLLFSPLHVLLAASSSAISLRAFDAVTFAYLFLGGFGIVLFFRDRGWHPGGAIVAAMAFALGGSANARIQHTSEVISLAYLPLTLWLIARALERSSWRAGLAAGLLGGLMVLGRDQVALLSLYVIAGFIVAHWMMGHDPLERMRSSMKPLGAAALTAAIVAAIPVIATALLAARSNRPEIGYASAAAGSLHPVHLLQFAFADLYGAMSSNQDYWAPQSFIWDAAWGWPGLYLSENMGLVYAGALTIAAVLSFGLIRGLAWAREIRFFSIAAALLLLYSLGGYTPAFRLMYELLPGVALYRRPADATFVLVALVAVISGYLVHRWLRGTVPPATARQRAAEIACPVILIAAALSLSHSVVGAAAAFIPVLTAIVFTTAAVMVLILARRLDAQWPLAATGLIAAFMAVDLAWNNAPHVSTALAPQRYDALRQGTGNETVRLLKARLAAAAAPDRRDRVELIGIGYQWPNLSLAQDFDHVFGHNPLRLRSFQEATHAGDTVALPSQRTFSPLYPSYRSAFADLLGIRFIATGVPVEEIDSSLEPGDLDAIAHTKDAYVYENPRALPRVMLMTDWRVADFDELIRSGWPSVDPRRTVLLQHAPTGFSSGAAAGSGGTARLLRYANTEVMVKVDAPAGGILLLNDVWHPWWRARVDAAETEILKANVIFRAVVVAPGRHVVRFSFHPFAGALAELRTKLTAHAGDQ